MIAECGKDFLYLIWNADEKQYVVGMLAKKDKYEFRYEGEVQQAIKKGFKPLIAFPVLERVYTSSQLFPSFTSRLPDKKRKDINQILSKYGLEEYQPYELLKKTGARLPIDNLEFVNPIHIEERNFRREFYVDGIYQPQCDYLIDVKKEEPILLECESKNRVAVYNQREEKLGYVPEFYAEKIALLLARKRKIRCKVDSIYQDNNHKKEIRLNLETE